jgi:hypothetical protein
MSPLVRFERYSELLAEGVISTVEATASVLDVLAEAGPDGLKLWAAAPEPLWSEVMAFLTSRGLASVPLAWVIGVNDPEWQAAQTARRRAVAAELLASAAERGTATRRGRN